MIVKVNLLGLRLFFRVFVILSIDKIIDLKDFWLVLLIKIFFRLLLRIIWMNERYFCLSLISWILLLVFDIGFVKLVKMCWRRGVRRRFSILKILDLKLNIIWLSRWRNIVILFLVDFWERRFWIYCGSCGRIVGFSILRSFEKVEWYVVWILVDLFSWFKEYKIVFVVFENLVDILVGVGVCWLEDDFGY